MMISNTMRGDSPIPTNDKCKGELHYDYPKSEFKSAALAINQAAIRMRQDDPKRSSPAWTIRIAEGRKRFLCDEDEIRDISLMQEGPLPWLHCRSHWNSNSCGAGRSNIGQRGARNSVTLLEERV
jgi:hypothetical protein